MVKKCSKSSLNPFNYIMQTQFGAYYVFYPYLILFTNHTFSKREVILASAFTGNTTEVEFNNTALFSLYFSLFKKNKFIYFWLRWVFAAARGLSLGVESGGYSSLRCASFSLRSLFLLRSTSSRHTGSVADSTRA